MPGARQALVYPSQILQLAGADARHWDAPRHSPRRSGRRGERVFKNRAEADYAMRIPLTFLFDGNSPAMPSAWKPNEISVPAAIIPFQEAFLIT